MTGKRGVIRGGGCGGDRRLRGGDRRVDGGARVGEGSPGVGGGGS